VGRFVAGLDAPTNANEFQRADCAPRSTLGDGQLTVADWVQAGRYAIGADPLTPAGGPAQPGGVPLVRFTPLDSSSRTITAVNVAGQVGQTCSVSVQLNSQGDENALGFSVNFDPTVLTLLGADPGSGAGGATLNVNTSNAASGTVGVALAMSTGSQFAAGTQEVVKLTFMIAASATDKTLVSFASQPVIREVANALAETLPTTYVNGSVSITPLLGGAGPLLTFGQTNGGLVLSWPASATGFVLESTGDLTSTNWSGVSATAVTNATDITVLIAPTNSGQYFRLRHPLP
jgi:hypothetical protein